MAEEDNCLICILGPNDSNPKVELTCCQASGAWIHKKCMEELFKSSTRRQCPHCRREITVHTVRNPHAKRKYIINCNPWWCCTTQVKACFGISILTILFLAIFSFFCYTFSVYTELYKTKCNDPDGCNLTYTYPDGGVKAMAIICIIFNTILFAIIIFEFITYLALLCLFSTQKTAKLIGKLVWRAHLLPGRVFFFLVRAHDRDQPKEYFFTRLYFNLFLRYLVTFIAAVIVAALDVITESSYWIYTVIFWTPFIIQYSIFLVYFLYLITDVIYKYLEKSFLVEEIGQNRQIIAAVATDDPFLNAIPSPPSDLVPAHGSGHVVPVHGSDHVVPIQGPSVRQPICRDTTTCVLPPPPIPEFCVKMPPPATLGASPPIYPTNLDLQDPKFQLPPVPPPPPFNATIFNSSKEDGSTIFQSVQIEEELPQSFSEYIKTAVSSPSKSSTASQP